MNLVNYETAGLVQAYAAVRKEAERLGVEIAGTEIVGLIPEKALDKSAEYFRKLEKFSEDKIFERRLRTCKEFQD